MQVESALVPGSAGQEARGSGQAQPQVSLDILNFPVDSFIYQVSLTRNLGHIVYEYGPRGVYAGYGSIRTELWELLTALIDSSASLSYPVRMTSNKMPTSMCPTPAIWNLEGITGQHGKSFLKKYKWARGVTDIPRTQGDPPVQSFINFFTNRSPG